MADTKVLANKDAEQSVLGSVFFDESTIKLLVDKIQVKDFYYLRHQLIYQTMIDLLASATPIDSTTVIASLQDKGQLNDCGGAQYIIELTDAVPTISNIETYIEIVKDKSIQRNVVQVCNDIIQSSNGDIPDTKSFLDEAEKKIFNATSERITRDMKSVGLMLEEAKDKIQERAQLGSTILGLDTGFSDINRYTLGFQPSELIILAARPSMGKTALALNMAVNVAKQKNHPYVAFFSLEMSLDQLALRMLSTESMIDQNILKLGQINDQRDWQRLNWAVSQLRDINLMFDDSGVSSVQDVRSICRKKKSENKLDFVVIDYLQLLSSSNKTESRVQEVSEISRVLKEMAKELKVPVLALSQLSRKVEEREDKVPNMSDLRESGSIEQDADVIMLIYRDEYYKKAASKEKNIARVIIGKNRNGVIGTAYLMFKPELTAFANLQKGMVIPEDNRD